jgi:hypothetical protein
MITMTRSGSVRAKIPTESPQPFGPRAACAGAIPGVTALPALPVGAPGRLRQSACHPMGALQRSTLTMRAVAVWPESARDIRRSGRLLRHGRAAPGPRRVGRSG